MTPVPRIPTLAAALISTLLLTWPAQAEDTRLAPTLSAQMTQDGLSWDARINSTTVDDKEVYFLEGGGSGDSDDSGSDSENEPGPEVTLLKGYTDQDLYFHLLTTTPRLAKQFGSRQAQIREALKTNPFNVLTSGTTDETAAVFRVQKDARRYLMLSMYGSRWSALAELTPARPPSEQEKKAATGCDTDQLKPSTCPAIFNKVGTVWTSHNGTYAHWYLNDRQTGPYIDSMVQQLTAHFERAAVVQKGDNDTLETLRADALSLARSMVLVDGQMYFPENGLPVNTIPSHDVPFATFSGKAVRVIEIQGKRYYSADTLSYDGYTLTRLPGAFTLAYKDYKGQKVTQPYTAAQKPAYRLSVLKTAYAASQKAKAAAVQAALKTKPAVEQALKKIADSYAYTGVFDDGTLQYTIVPKGNDTVLLIARIKNANTATWQSCSVLLSRGFVAVRAAVLNEHTPYFVLDGPSGRGGQSVSFEKGAPMYKTSFDAMPKCALY